MSSAEAAASASLGAQLRSGSPSPFALSFERVTIESLASSWHDIEALVKQLDDRRRAVENHTKAAAEHLRSIALVNGEIDCLEKKFSSVLAGMVAERTRVQDRLRALVLEWERTSANSMAERAKEVQRTHEAELRRLRDAVDTVTAERDRKDRELLAAQQKISDMEVMLSEYGLSLSGPLVESLRARAILLSQHERPAVSGRGAGEAPPTTALSSAATAPPQSPQQQQQGVRRSSMTTGAQHLQYVTTASREMVVETEHLRHEVTKLQADLAASKVESKMRLDELKVLRGVRDEVAASLTLQGLGGGRSVASTSNISAAMTMTSAARAEEPAPLSGSHPHQQRSPLSPERVSAFSFAAEQQPNQRRGSSHAHVNYSSASAHGSQQHAVGPSPSTPKPVHHVSLGLDLGTRRQQAGLRGVHVTDVVEGSSAHQAGIRRNNVLLAVAGKAVNSLEDVAGAVAAVKPNSQVVVEYASSGHGGALGDVVRATILVAGYLNGPHNSRREVFRSP